MAEQHLATRPATDGDFQYAWRVYSEAVKPYIEPKLKNGWIDEAEIERFRKVWNVADTHIITINGAAIGWAGAVISDTEVRIDHLYIEADHRGKGYGSKLVSEMSKTWTDQGKRIVAPVMKDQRLIDAAVRLGFQKHAEGDDTLVQLLVMQKK